MGLKSALKSLKSSPLEVRVVDGELVIRIGVDTLAWAFDNSVENNPFSDALNDYQQAWKVKNAAEFAVDVRRALLEEGEDGTTALHILFDAAAQAAVNGGSLAVKECKRRKRPDKLSGR